MKIITNKNRKITSIILALAVAFAYLPAMTNADYGKAAKKLGKVTVKTSKKKPGKVKGLKVVKKGKRSVTLKWRKAKRAKKYIVYKKRVRTKFKKVKVTLPNGEPLIQLDFKGNKKYVYKMESKQVGKYKKAKTTKKTKVTVKKLKPGKEYRFKVVAKNKAGKGKESKQPRVEIKKTKLTKKEKKLMKLMTIKDFEASGDYKKIDYYWTNKYNSKKSGVTHYELWYQKIGSNKWNYSTVITSEAEKNNQGNKDAGWHVTVDKGNYIAKIRACKNEFKGPFSVVRGQEKFKGPFTGLWIYDINVH